MCKRAWFVLCCVPLLTLLWIPATRTMITLTFNFFLFIHVFLSPAVREERGHYRHNIAYTDSLRSTNKVQYIWDLNANRGYCKFMADASTGLIEVSVTG